MTDHSPHIIVFGAGSIGCYLGACLASVGAHVTLVGRERVISGISQHGLTASDFKGRHAHIPAERLTLVTDIKELFSKRSFNDDQGRVQADAVLVTVKSAATESAAADLAPYLATGTCVISFQNGIDNAQRLQTALPQAHVLSGMVPFNVIDRGNGAFHQGSAGDLEVEAGEMDQAVEGLFREAAIPLLRPANMAAVRWGKLLLNLNNPINALSGLPLRDELAQRDFRRCLAMAQREALHWMNKSDIQPAKVTPLPPAWLPTLLDTPDWLFTRAAKRMLAIDPLARSSMWEDLQTGRPTEIDWINGEILTLAQKTGGDAPVNRRLVELIRAAETGGKRDWTGAGLLAQLQTQ